MDEEFTTDIDTSVEVPEVEVDTPNLLEDDFSEPVSDIVEDAPSDSLFDNEEAIESIDEISEDVSLDTPIENDDSIETLDSLPEDDIEILDVEPENEDTLIGDEINEDILDEDFSANDVDLLDVNEDCSNEMLNESEENVPETIEEDFPDSLTENDCDVSLVEDGDNTDLTGFEEGTDTLLDENQDSDSNVPIVSDEETFSSTIESNSLENESELSDEEESDVNYDSDQTSSDSQKIEDLVSRIQGSDISDDDKAELLSELDSSLNDLEENNPVENISNTDGVEEIPVDEDEAVPVKVLTPSGYDTGIHKPDYEQELYDLDEGILNARKPYDDIISSLEEDAAKIYADDSLSNQEKLDLLNDTKTKIQQTEDLWREESAEYFNKRDELQNKVNNLGNDELINEEISPPFEMSDGIINAQDSNVESNHADSTDSFHIQDTEEISNWLGDINPNYDEFDIESPYCNNCGSCAWSVYNRLNGDTSMVASAENIPYNDQMNALTGMEQVSMSPEEIQQRLLEQGDGAHAIIGIDRAEGPGHWFNAACVDGKVVAIDGQTGEILDWPPDYGDVVNWEMSVKKGDE